MIWCIESEEACSATEFDAISALSGDVGETDSTDGKEAAVVAGLVEYGATPSPTTGGPADVEGVDAFQAIDFGEHPFSEQMRIVHNTTILVGMHGGGLFHTLSMDTDRRVSVIELYPKRWADGRGPTIGHLARLLGIRHDVHNKNPDKTRYLKFIFQAYEAPYFWWEIVESIRKLLLTVVVVFFTPDRIMEYITV